MDKLEKPVCDCPSCTRDREERAAVERSIEEQQRAALAQLDREGNWMLLRLLVAVVIFAAVIYVPIHFIIKFW